MTICVPVTLTKPPSAILYSYNSNCFQHVSTRPCVAHCIYNSLLRIYALTSGLYYAILRWPGLVHLGFELVRTRIPLAGIERGRGDSMKCMAPHKAARRGPIVVQSSAKSELN